MDYEKYEEALKRAKELLEDMDKKDYFASKADIENIFPELKEQESEDERVRKELIAFIRKRDRSGCDYDYDKWITWLEKQVTQNPVEWSEEDEKIKESIKKVLANTNFNRLDIKYSFCEMITWLEKQKDNIKLPNSAYTSNKDVNEFADKYSHDVWENLMDNFKKIENYHIGCNDVSDIVLNAIINTYNWLEKQDEKKSIFNADDWYVSEVDGKIHNPKFIEKQDENKTDFSNIRVWKYIVDMVLTEENGIGQYLDNPDTERIAKKLQERYGNIEKQGEKATHINKEDCGIDGLYHAIKILEETVGRVTGYQSDDGILEHKAAINAVKELYKNQGEIDPCTNCINDKGCVTCENGNMKETETAPKFKVGDWVVNNVCFPMKIASIKDSMYIFTKGDAMSVLFIDGNFHLWTIHDAMDGDVLATNESVFIYAKVLYNKPYAYCGIDKFGVFKDNCLENNWSNSVDNIYPATKEQCDLLFQKIKEAGFEWDSTKKQLKKIELNVNVRLLPEVLSKHLYTCFTKTNHYVRSEEDHITLIEFINKIIADLNIEI